MMRLVRFGLLLIVVSIALAHAQPPPSGRAGGHGAVPVMTLGSSAWPDGGQIPIRYTQAGEDASPPLAWSNVPDGTASFVLIAHDVDAAVGNGTDDTLHWLLWNIPPTVTSLPERFARGSQLADGTRQISATGPNYRGPGAAASGPPHHYVFELFALDAVLDVPAVGASPAQTRAAIVAAMAGHVRGKAAFVGLFKRQAAQHAGTSPAGLYYEVTGDGEPVVLIPAFSVDRRMWDAQVAVLKDRFKVVRYDLRGHGKSEAPSAPYSTSDDLRSVLDAVGVKRAALVGLSAGSQVATDFALVHPDRVTRLVLAAAAPGGHPTPPLPWMQPVLQAAGAGDPQRAAQLWAETPIMALRNDTSGAATLRDIVMDNARLWTFRSNPVQPLTPPAIKRLSEIKVPTLVIVGERDLPHIQEGAKILADGIAGAKLVTVPGAGHIVNFDARDRFNEELVRFLTGK